jgi:hypothetical protein
MKQQRKNLRIKNELTKKKLPSVSLHTHKEVWEEDDELQQHPICRIVVEFNIQCINVINGELKTRSPVHSQLFV